MEGAGVVKQPGTGQARGDPRQCYLDSLHATQWAYRDTVLPHDTIISGVFRALSVGLGARTALRLVAGQSRERTAWLAFRDLPLAWVA
jgi:hypothetical protein